MSHLEKPRKSNTPYKLELIPYKTLGFTQNPKAQQSSCLLSFLSVWMKDLIYMDLLSLLLFIQFIEQKSSLAHKHGWLPPNCTRTHSKVMGLPGRKQLLACCARKSLDLAAHKASHLCWGRNSVNQNTNYNYQWFSYSRRIITTQGDVSHMVTNTSKSSWNPHLFANNKKVTVIP